MGPYIAAEIHQYRINAFDGVEMSGQCIVVFDLGGVLALQSQFSFEEPVGKLRPVVFRERNLVRIEVAGGHEFSHEGNVAEQLDLVLEPLHEYHHFFSQFCRTGGLPVCGPASVYVFPGRAGFRWRACRLMTEGGNRVQYSFSRAGDRRIVDVLRGQSKMHPFFQVARPALSSMPFRKYSTAFTSWLVMLSVF